MRRYIFWTLVLLLVGGVLSLISKSEQGYVLFRLGDTTIETTIWFLIIALTVTIVALWFAIRFFLVLVGYPRIIGKVVTDIDTNNRKKSLENMLLAHFSGDYTASEKYAIKCNDKQLSSAISNIYRVESMIYQGKIGLAAPTLERIRKGADQRAEPALLALQMQLYLSQGRYKEVIASFELLPKNFRKLIRWQDIHWQALQALGEIRTLITSLPSPYQYSGKDQQRIFDYYRLAMANLNQSSNDNAPEDIRWLWKQLPAKMQQQRYYAESYIKALLKEQDFTEAEKQLRVFARIADLGVLMQYWGNFKAPKLHDSLKLLEKIYQNNQDQWIGLGLGLLCLQVELWGKAESYMSTTLAMHTDPQIRTILLITLARLYHSQGDTDNTTRCLSKLEPEALLHLDSDYGNNSY